MKEVVVDSTVLIYLSKIGRLSLLNELSEEVFVSEAVHEEVVVDGLEYGYADALAVDNADFLSVTGVEESEDVNSLRDSANLGVGECEAIILAHETDALCLTDDCRARKTAESLGVDVGGTVYVLLSSLKSGTIEFSEYEQALNDLSETDFRMKASLYRRALEEGRKF